MLLAVLCVLAAPREAAAQHDKPRTVTLPATGLTVEIPGGWVARATPWNVDGHLLDMVTRVEPAQPMLFFMLDKHAGKTCAEWERLSAGGGNQVRNPVYLPEKWHPVALEAPRDQGTNVSMCFQAPGVVYLAAVEYKGAASDPDFQWVTPVLERIATAAGGGGAASAPPGGKTRLQGAMMEVALPPGWVARYEARGGGPVDIIERVSPASPRLVLLFARVPQEGTCQNWEDGLREEGSGAALVDRPAFLPPGWHPFAHRRSANGFGACLDRSAGMYIALFDSDQPLSIDEAQVFRPVLASISGGQSRLPGVGLPAPAPAPPPPAPSAAAATAPPSPELPAPPPPSAPSSMVDDYDDSGDILDYSRYRLLEGARLDLAVGYIQPDAGAAQLAFQPLFDAEIFAGGEIFGFYANFGLGVGVTTAAHVPFDLHAAIGPGFDFGPVAIAPFLGIGIDTLGAGPASAFNIDAAFYWDVGGRLRIGTFSGVGLEATGLRTFRGSIDTSAALDVSNINMVTGGLFYRFDAAEIRASFQWKGYEYEPGTPIAQSLGGLAGYGWLFD